MQDLAASILASLVSSYASLPPSEDMLAPRVIGRNLPKAQGKTVAQSWRVNADGSFSSGSLEPSAPQDSGAQAAPIHHAPPPVSDKLPEPGALQAAGFLKALRNAGVRKGKMVQVEVLGDEKRAIAAYVGYQVGELHGAQREAARATAYRELKPVKVNAAEGFTRSTSPTAVISGEGYYAGKVDMTTKAIENLKAREVLAADSLSSHLKEFRDFTRTLDQRRTSQLMMKLEEERLAQIRVDLKNLGAI
jgi:hypothetical protein